MVVTGSVFQDFARGASFVKGHSAQALSSANGTQPSAVSHRLSAISY